MLTDEKKAMMLASFDVFRRPTPKMYRIQKSHDLAVHYWGLGVPLTHNSLKELWFKLYRERRAAVFNDRELSNLWRVIFTTVADGLLPLIDSPEALSIVVDALRERGKADKSEDFLRKWFDYYRPGRECRSEGATRWMLSRIRAEGSASGTERLLFRGRSLSSRQLAPQG